VVDDGVSGGRRERLVRLEAAVRTHEARAVVVYALDRFARDVAAMLDALRAWAKRSVGLYVVGRGRVEVETSAGFLMASVEGVLAEHYRRAISEKTTHALARLRETGRRYTRVAPYGYQGTPDGRLVPHVGEQRALAVMRALKASGIGYRALAVELVDRGLVQRNGRRWSAQLLHRVLVRQPIDLSVDRSQAAGAGA
jgi:DNA invertase Pin-like site-specific DNA recombinase